MSRYEWERGEGTLPSGEATRLRKTLRETHNRRRAAALAEAKAWWKKNRTSSRKKYGEALDRDTRVPVSSGWGAPRKPVLSEDAAGVLREANGSPWEHGWANGTDYQGRQRAALRGPQERDVDRSVGEKATNRTTVFRVDGGEAAISFNGSSVTWEVGENNHAVERAREDPMAQTFFAGLDKVRWTAKTGFRCYGGDEYQRDAEREHGYSAGPYETGVWGAEKKRRDLEVGRMTGRVTGSGRPSRATGFKCGQATTSGRACQRPVAARGDRCPAHR